MKTTKVTVAKNLTPAVGRKRVFNAAKKKGHGDARGLRYNPKTGKGSAT